MSIHLAPTFADLLAETDRPLLGMWVCSVSPVMAEIAAGSGLDWVLIDAEHSPQSLLEMQTQLQATEPYAAAAVIRTPSSDPTLLKQILDLGAQNLIVPMISTGQQAEAVVLATTYPPRGIRGVGSALARSGRWGRIPNYLENADDHVSVFVQIETVEGVENTAEIASTPGVRGVLVGPSDLAASMGLIGQQYHPDVVAQVLRVFQSVKGANVPVGVNAFDPDAARRYMDAGADFVLVGADVTMVARGSEELAKKFTQSG